MTYTLVDPPIGIMSPLIEVQAWHKKIAAMAKKNPDDRGLAVAYENATDMLARAQARADSDADL